MIRVLLLIGTLSVLSANVAVPGDSYRKLEGEKVEVIYSAEYPNLAQQVLHYESTLLKLYSHSFGYELDDKQYVGLLSSHNQVANAYSTQIPFNLQMNFPGGALAPDYFTGRSWIRTLLLHESAHNFQLNPKKNLLSHYAHKWLKNSFVTTVPFLFIPVFPLPNLAESSFILEGNAVLNESWHNNGGRLYNGTLLAMAITQAKAGYITPERTYNNHLYFPYGTHHYIVGGFFQLFLAQQFGIDKVNSYFDHFSRQWIPVFTNAVFKETFGINFEQALKQYNSWMLQKANNFHPSGGRILATSKAMVKLNSDANEVMFLCSDDRSKPQLLRLNKASGLLSKKSANYLMGRVFKVGSHYYSAASAPVSPEHIMIGLYDENGKLLKSSASKAVQSVDKAGKMVYFDIPSSYDIPQMVVDGKQYDKVNSSVFTDTSGEHYYFKQADKTRTLYQNKKAVFSFQGWFGFVCDVDENGIYFIANTQNGSGLYRYHDKQIQRMSEGDDIVDARVLPGQKALVETIDSEGVSFREIPLYARSGAVFETDYFFENDARFNQLNFSEKASKSEPYNGLSNLHYSALSQSIYTTGSSVDFDISAHFTDPLSQNDITLFTAKIEEKILAGAGFESTLHRFNFGGSLYGVAKHDDNVSSRGFGASLYGAYPLLKNSYERLDLRVSYLLDDDKEAKEPLTLSVDYSNHQHFGHSMYLNSQNDLQLAVGLDRHDKAAGAKYQFSKALRNQFYAGLALRGGYSDAASFGEKRGLKLQQYANRFSDALSFEMPSLNNDLYLKQLGNVELSVKKVFDLDKYFFSFPVSLRREALYGKYNYYNMKFLDNSQADFHEFTTGVKADLLYFNSAALPLSIEYIYNDRLKNANHFRILFDLHL